MHNFNEFVALIKRTAIDAVNSSKPVAIVYGKVTSISPLKVYIDQKKILTNLQLVRTKTVENLNIGDKVIMIQVQGGQKFVVIDKVIS